MAKKNDDSNMVPESVDVAALKKQLDDVCAKVRRMSDNWKKFAAKFIGATDDGKLSGRASVGLAGIVLLSCLVAGGIVMARDVWNVGSTAIGTAKVTTADAGTATLQVDAVTSVSLEGAVGSVTPAAGAFTTVSASGNITANGNIVGDAATIVTNVASVWSPAYYAGTSAGMTTNILCYNGATTNQLTFTAGILTAVAVYP